jgi:dethiobiotin synthetase
MKGVFVTGTNTEVGKTHIAAILASQLKNQGVTVIPRKPIESGCIREGDELIPQDAKKLKEAAGYEGSLSEVCPYRFEPPISPARAAHLANKVLTTEQLVNICLAGSENGFLVVEGAGGFYSPLSENGLNADLAIALQLPVLLVAHDVLGCLSQVLLSAEAIKIRGISLAGVILNSTKSDQSEHMDNAADLRQSLDCPIYSQPFNAEGGELPQPLIDHLLSQQAHGKVARLVG